MQKLSDEFSSVRHVTILPLFDPKIIPGTSRIIESISEKYPSIVFKNFPTDEEIDNHTSQRHYLLFRRRVTMYVILNNDRRTRMFTNAITIKYNGDAPRPKCVIIQFNVNLGEAAINRLLRAGGKFQQFLDYTMIEVKAKSICSMPITRYYDPFNDEFYEGKLNEINAIFPDKFCHVNGYPLTIYQPPGVYKRAYGKGFFSYNDKGFLQSLSIAVNKLNFSRTIFKQKQIKDAKTLAYLMDIAGEIEMNFQRIE